MLGWDLWSGFTGRGKVLQVGACNVGFVKWILQCRVYGIEFAGWSFLKGAIRRGLLGGINWVGWAGLVYWIEFAGSDEICWVGV